MPVKREFKKEPEMGEAEFFAINSYRDTVSQFVAERSAILLVLAIKLTQDTRRRV